jgi:hypothetical protein
MTPAPPLPAMATEKLRAGPASALAAGGPDGVDGIVKDTRGSCVNGSRQ